MEAVLMGELTGEAAGEPEGRGTGPPTPLQPFQVKWGRILLLRAAFSCMKPSVRPSAMASSTTWLYS